MSVQRTSGLTIEELARAVIDALLGARFVRRVDVELATEIATEEIVVRKALGDYDEVTGGVATSNRLANLIVVTLCIPRLINDENVEDAIRLVERVIETKWLEYGMLKNVGPL